MRPPCKGYQKFNTMDKFKLYLLWTFKIIISILFLLASTGKLAQDEAVIDMFRNWGYFNGFYLIIGILEFSLAILLLFHKTSMYAAIALMVIMIGAMFTHFIHDPIAEVVRPLIFMGVLCAIVYLQHSMGSDSTDSYLS